MLRARALNLRVRCTSTTLRRRGVDKIRHSFGVFSGVTFLSTSWYRILPSAVFAYFSEPPFEPSFIGWPTTVILSPALNVSRVQPWRAPMFGPELSKSQVPTVRLSFAPFGTTTMM